MHQILINVPYVLIFVFVCICMTQSTTSCHFWLNLFVSTHISMYVYMYAPEVESCYIISDKH